METPQGKIPPFGVRMPPEIKAWVEARAKKERMSMNSWILRLIEGVMDPANAK